MQELEDEQGLDLGRRSGDEEQVGVGEAEDERGRAGVGQIDQARARRRMLEIQGQQVGGRQRSPRVGVRQQRASAEWLAGGQRGQCGGGREHLLSSYMCKASMTPFMLTSQRPKSGIFGR